MKSKLFSLFDRISFFSFQNGCFKVCVKTMIYFVSIIHALTCVFVVLFILLQDPKGGVLGSLGGGGGKSFFGSEGASPFLVKVTKWLAIIFACSSFYLSYVSSKQESRLMAPQAVKETAPLDSAPQKEAEPSEPAGNKTSP